MMADYYLNVYDTSGDLQFVVTDFSSLSYLRKVNAPGLLQVGLRGDHPVLAAIGDKWQVQVFRKPDGGAFARDFTGLARQVQFSYADKSAAALTCPGLMSLLSWRIVAYYANLANRTKFITAQAETIMKTLVSYNAGSSAITGNSRLRNGAITGLTVEADGANGNSLDWFCAYDNLLETLQKLATIAGGDFDLVQTAVDAWQFRWYTAQLGSDKTASVIFAMERGNMANPQYESLRTGEKTVCIIGGKGEDAARATAIRTGANYAAGNDIEMFTNASDCDTTAGLQARGDATLKENQASEKFSFDVLQTPATSYGTHYNLGDLVTAVNPFTAAGISLKVDEVNIAISERGDEIIDVKMVVP
jgi:hypothetical protein